VRLMVVVVVMVFVAVMTVAARRGGGRGGRRHDLRRGRGSRGGYASTLSCVSLSRPVASGQAQIRRAFRVPACRKRVWGGANVSVCAQAWWRLSDADKAQGTSKEGRKAGGGGRVAKKPR